MRKRLGLLLVTALVLTALLTGCGGGDDYTISIVNENFGLGIAELYLTPEAEETWGDNLLQAAVGDGSTSAVKLIGAAKTPASFYDLMILDNNGEQHEFYGLTLSDKAKIEFVDADPVYVRVSAKDGSSSKIEATALGVSEIKVDTKNNLMFDLESLCLSATGAASWGDNLIPSGLAQGANSVIDMNAYLENEFVDIWLKDVCGNNYGFDSVSFWYASSAELIWAGTTLEIRVTYEDGTTETVVGRYTPAEVQGTESKLPPVAADKVAAPKIRTTNGGAIMHSDPGDSGYYYGQYGYYDPWGNYYYYAWDDNGYYDANGNYILFASDSGDTGYCYGEFGYFDPAGNYYLYNEGDSYDYYSYYWDYYNDYYYYGDDYYDPGYYYYHDDSYIYYDSWDSYYYDYYDYYDDYWDYSDYSSWDWDYWDSYSYWDSSYWSDYWDSSYSSYYDSGYSSYYDSYSSYYDSYSSYSSYGSSWGDYSSYYSW